jgi:hypothetical protein
MKFTDDISGDPNKVCWRWISRVKHAVSHGALGVVFVDTSAEETAGHKSDDFDGAGLLVAEGVQNDIPIPVGMPTTAMYSL